jgi:hypothetical protein
VYIRCTAGEGNNWTVSLNVVDAEDGEVLHESPTFCLKDPWTVDEYRKHLNPVCSYSLKPPPPHTPIH